MLYARAGVETINGDERELDLYLGDDRPVLIAVRRDPATKTLCSEMEGHTLFVLLQYENTLPSLLQVRLVLQVRLQSFQIGENMSFMHQTYFRLHSRIVLSKNKKGQLPG